MEYLTDAQEEILELLWIQTQEQKMSPEVSVFRDNKAFDQLVERGCVNIIKDKNVSLTDKGLRDARECVRRHRLAERLMVDILDLKNDLIHEAGCKFEHALHKGVEENICIILGHPRVCPHGSQIPEGECCRKLKKIPEPLIESLTELKLNESGKIAYLHTQDKSALKKLIALGALPGMKVKLVQKSPSFVFDLGNSQFAVDKTLAEQIYVHRTKR